MYWMLSNSVNVLNVYHKDNNTMSELVHHPLLYRIYLAVFDCMFAWRLGVSEYSFLFCRSANIQLMMIIHPESETTCSFISAALLSAAFCWTLTNTACCENKVPTLNMRLWITKAITTAKLCYFIYNILSYKWYNRIIITDACKQRLNFVYVWNGTGLNYCTLHAVMMLCKILFCKGITTAVR